MRYHLISIILSRNFGFFNLELIVETLEMLTKTQAYENVDIWWLTPHKYDTIRGKECCCGNISKSNAFLITRTLFPTKRKYPALILSIPRRYSHMSGR